MALAVASGVPPQHGLYTALVAGGLIAILGGSRVQVSGPTAAFVILLAPVSARFGLAGLLLASLMAGALLVVMGLARMGRLIEFVPYPVTTGFTAGIAVVIATLQAKDFLGLRVEGNPEHYLDRVRALAQALPTANVWDAAIGTLTLVLLFAWPRLTSRVPAPLVALALAAVTATVCAAYVPGFEVATIGSRFHTIGPGGQVVAGIPRQLPSLAWPWSMPGAGGAPPGLSFGLVRALLPSAFAIAMLGAIESLLSAVVADGMTGRKHDPDGELVAQGIGNLVAPFFGGFAATGALARTATNVRAGARSPLASVVHSLSILAALQRCWRRSWASCRWPRWRGCSCWWPGI
jgi:SulP family sulfate permease